MVIDPRTDIVEHLAAGLRDLADAATRELLEWQAAEDAEHERAARAHEAAARTTDTRAGLPPDVATFPLDSLPLPHLASGPSCAPLPLRAEPCTLCAERLEALAHPPEIRPDPLPLRPAGRAADALQQALAFQVCKLAPQLRAAQTAYVTRRSPRGLKERMYAERMFDAALARLDRGLTLFSLPSVSAADQVYAADLPDDSPDAEAAAADRDPVRIRPHIKCPPPATVRFGDKAEWPPAAEDG